MALCGGNPAVKTEFPLESVVVFWYFLDTRKKPCDNKLEMYLVGRSRIFEFKMCDIKNQHFLDVTYESIKALKWSKYIFKITLISPTRAFSQMSRITHKLCDILCEFFV